jgi:hypothetical protein
MNEIFLRRRSTKSYYQSHNSSKSVSNYIIIKIKDSLFFKIGS